MLQKLLAGGFVGILLLLSGLPAQVQAQDTTAPQTEPQAAPATDVSDSEIEQFARAVQQVQQIQTSAQTEASELIASSGLSETRFSEILVSQQNPQEQPSSEVTPEEQQSFDQAVSQLLQLQSETDQQIEQAIASEGLDLERFNQILSLAQQDPQLRQRVQENLPQ